LPGRFRARIVHEAVGEIARRKADGGILSFGDLLHALARALGDPEVATAVRSAIRARFEVALVDEFQDTDPIQWQIFASVFDDTRLVLVGDPKQAIYAFRGADVHTYLDAVDAVAPDARRTLRTNYRSDAPLLAALERLFGREDAFGADGVFAEEGIGFVGVQAADTIPDDRWSHPDGPGARVRIRFLDRDLVTAGADATKPLDKGPTIATLVRAVVDEIASLLAAGATIGTGDARRAALPGDLAVLVRTRDQAERMQEALLDAGVPAVVADDRSVFETAAALALERLLAAVLHPADERRVRAALAGPVLGFTAAEIDAFDAQMDIPVQRALDTARGRWHRDGIYRALRGLLTDTGAQPRIAGTARGERLLTDLLAPRRAVAPSGDRPAPGTRAAARLAADATPRPRIRRRAVRRRSSAAPRERRRRSPGRHRAPGEGPAVPGRVVSVPRPGTAGRPIRHRVVPRSRRRPTARGPRTR
jgi:exodeoxyribonuclease V beta subunit